MPKLIYATLCSLDGFIADENGSFDWAAPSAEVHAFVNDLMRPLGTAILGRRTFEVLEVWEDPSFALDQPPEIVDYQRIWLGSEKIVGSRTLESVTTARTRIEPELTAESIAQLKSAATADLSIGGPTLATIAIEAGLVDDFHFIFSPVIIGSGLRALPPGVRIDLELVSQRGFENGAIHAHYRPSHRLR